MTDEFNCLYLDRVVTLSDRKASPRGTLTVMVTNRQPSYLVRNVCPDALNLAHRVCLLQGYRAAVLAAKSHYRERVRVVPGRPLEEREDWI